MPYFAYKEHKIYYEDQGSGECLLFVHEWNSSSLAFRKLNLKYFARELRVVCTDLPGFGNSEYIEDLVYDDFSAILLELLDVLKIQTVSLMGFCLGAAIILDFHQKHPDRVKSLILIEPIVNFPRILRPLLNPWFGIAFLKYLGRKPLLFSIFGTPLTGWDKTVRNQVFSSMGTNDPVISQRYLQLLFRKRNQTDLRSLDTEIQDKCICIFGKDTIRLFRRNAAFVLRRFRIRNYHVLEDARHFVLIERPAEAANIVIGYLKRGDG